MATSLPELTNQRYTGQLQYTNQLGKSGVPLSAPVWGKNPDHLWGVSEILFCRITLKFGKVYLRRQQKGDKHLL